MIAYSIGVDLGGTNLRVAAIDSVGNMLEKVSAPAIYHAGPEKVIAEIAAVINQVRVKIGSDGLRGVGIGVPGYVDIDAGFILKATNLPGFEKYPIRDLIQEKLDTRRSFSRTTLTPPLSASSGSARVKE